MSDDDKRERRRQMKYLTDVLIEDSTEGIDAVLELMERFADGERPYLRKSERRLIRRWCSGMTEHNARVANTLKDYWTLFTRMDEIVDYQKDIIGYNDRLIKTLEHTIKLLRDRLGDTDHD